MPPPDVMRVPRILWTAVRRPVSELWRAARYGDQAAMIGTLLQLAEEAAHPDASHLDARPLGPGILVVHSVPGLLAMAEEPALDKAPTTNVAVAVSGDAGAVSVPSMLLASPDPGLKREYNAPILFNDAQKIRITLTNQRTQPLQHLGLGFEVELH